MTCTDVGRLVDAFIDTELPPGEMIDVARHAGGCAGCDRTIRELETLRHAVGATVDAEIDALDLSGVWQAVSGDIDRVDAKRVKVRRLRQAPVWGAALAMAASAVFFLLPTIEQPEPSPRADVSRFAQIDRLSGRDITVRHVKDGTPMIWVRQVADAR